MKVVVILFSNGSMTATYDDGRPAHRYSGSWTKLHKLINDAKLYKKSGLPKHELINEIEVHFAILKGATTTSLLIPEGDILLLLNQIKTR